MRTFAVFLLLAVAPVFGQATVDTSGFRGLIDGLIIGNRIKMERERQAMEADLARSQGKLLDAQAEAIRAQTERLKQQSQPPAPAVPDTAFNRAAHAVELRYPDFQEYKDEAARLIPEFDTSKGLDSLNLEHYIESLYLIAKYASFSSKATPVAKAVDVLTGDPEFHRLPMATRIKFLKAVAPELARFPDDDWVIILDGMAARLEKAEK